MDACNYNADATADDGSCDYGSMCWDGSYECNASDCPDQPGGSVEVYYNTSTDIAGFQFNVEGVTVTGAGGGAAEAAGFMISANETTVIGFSLTGSTIPAGEGVLVVLDVTGDGDACLEDIIISDSSGSALETSGDCTTIIVDEVDDNVYGCMDMDACNYNADATADDGSCDYGTMCWDGSYECDATDCPDQPGGSVEVYYNSDTPIAGFQFDITGVTGQDGSYLAELLLTKGYEVHGIVRRVALEDEAHRIWRIRHILDDIILHAASLESYASIFKIVQKIKPDEVYHLAAQSYVTYSFEDEFSTLNTNINGTHYILSAVKEFSKSLKFYFAASSEMF